MEHERTRRRIVPALIAMVLAAAPGANAEEAGEQLKRFHQSWVAAGKARSNAAFVPKEFGTGEIDVINVHAYEFQANTSTDLIQDDGNGYRYFGAPAVPYMAAPVRLPSGALIFGLEISYCAANDGDLVVALYDNGSGGSGGGGGNLIAGPVALDAGCGTGGLLTGYEYVTNFEHPLYLVVHFAGEAIDGSTKFNYVGIHYTRQVLPALGSATFTDVPATDFGFDYIEALAASGITGGCGNGDYCPDSPVNRRQMAIFLAKALGLHWPN